MKIPTKFMFTLTVFFMICTIFVSSTIIPLNSYGEQSCNSNNVVDANFCTETDIESVLSKDNITELVRQIRSGNDCAIDFGVKIYVYAIKTKNADIAEVLSLAFGDIYLKKAKKILMCAKKHNVASDISLRIMLMNTVDYSDDYCSIATILEARYEATKNINNHDLIDLKNKVMGLFKHDIDQSKRACHEQRLNRGQPTAVPENR